MANRNTVNRAAFRPSDDKELFVAYMDLDSKLHPAPKPGFSLFDHFPLNIYRALRSRRILQQSDQ